MDRLPVELVWRILHRMSLADIMNTARTCSYLRAISLSDREIWANALDSVDIHLPLGKTLGSVEAVQLPRRAYRAISLQRKWKESIICPSRSSRPRLSALPYWTRWWTNWTPQKPQWFRLLPGGQLFLIGKSYAMGIYDLLGRFGHEINLGGTPIGVDWICTDNGASLTLGILLTTTLAIYHLRQNRSSGLIVSPPKRIRVPLEPEGLSMKHSTALIWGRRSLFLHDLKTGVSVHLSPPLENPAPKIGWASLHPFPPIRAVMLSVTAETRTQFTRTLSVAENMWTLPLLPKEQEEFDDEGSTRRLISRALETVRGSSPIHRPLRRFPLHFFLGVDSDHIEVLDILTYSTTPMVSIPAAKPPISIRDYEYFWPCPTSCGRLFVFRLQDGIVDLFRYSPGEMCRLGSLDSVVSDFVNSSNNPPSVVMAFDPVQGILLLGAHGSILVLQY
ncbi:hypothetical protein B0H11DRAFT_2289462 [Mycena galericulata]|nr:hypothetical protein B0H11DRAFT_2289462 [Mycena galericulata]